MEITKDDLVEERRKILGYIKDLVLENLDHQAVLEMLDKKIAEKIKNESKALQ